MLEEDDQYMCICPNPKVGIAVLERESSSESPTAEARITMTAEDRPAFSENTKDAEWTLRTSADEHRSKNVVVFIVVEGPVRWSPLFVEADRLQHV